MDKEKNNDIESNIDDVLKLLKNTYENEDEATQDSELASVGSAESISPEALSERLRAQFMSGGETFSEEQKGEYDIDESLISEFLDEAEAPLETVAVEEAEEIEVPEVSEISEEPLEAEETVVAEDIEEIEEPEEAEESIELETFEESEVSEEQEDMPVSEDREGEIVEIVIPFVESLRASASGLDEEEPEEEENDDFYDEGADSGENSYICFADDNASDEEIFEQEAEESELDGAALLVDRIDEEESDNDDDLPWYNDDEMPLSEKPTEPQKAEEPVIILPIDEDETDGEELQDAFEAALDEELGVELEDVEQINISEILSGSLVQSSAEIIEQPSSEEVVEAVSVSAEGNETEEVLEEAYEEALPETETAEEATEEERPVYKLFSTPTTDISSEKVEEEDTSFYRTIIDARTERELQYGYPRTSADDFADAIDEAATAIENNRDVDSDEEPQPLYDEIVQQQEVQVKTVLGSTIDYYGEGEQTEDPDEDIDRNAPSTEPVLEFEHEEITEADIQENNMSALIRIVKPVIMAILAVAIFVLEMRPILMPMLGMQPAEGIFDYTSFSLPYILIDVQLLIFAAALCYDRLLDGLVRIVRLEANFYSIVSVTLIVTLLSSLLSCFSDELPMLYNFVSAAYIFAVYVFERLDIKRRKEGEMMLDGKSVFSLRQSQGKNSTAEKMYLGGVDPDTNILEPVELKVEDLLPSFNRERVERSRSFYNSLIVGAITPAVIFSIIMAVVCIVRGRGLIATANALSFSFVATAPLCAIIAYYLPIFISNKRLSERECVIAGYESASEIAKCDAFVFGDCHMFKECSAKEAGIKLYCDENKTRELFVCLAAAYSKIGGPMQNTFSSVLEGKEHRVNMIRITRSGFEAIIDGRTNLIVGSSEYLSRYGIITDRADTRTDGVIYAAMNSVLCAKISVMYKSQPLFETLGEILEEYGIRAVVETYDPMISGKYVAKCRPDSSQAVSVVHKNVTDYNLPASEKVSASKLGVFAASSRLKLVELIGFCKRITLLRKLNAGILIGSYALSGLLCTLFVIGGAIESASLLWVLLYQLAVIGIYSFASLYLLPLSFDAREEKKYREAIKKQERETKKEI